MGVLRSQATQPGTAVTVGGSSVALAGQSRSSSGARYFANDHATQVVYLRLAETGAALNQGIRLGPGQSIVLESYTGPVCAIATGAGTVVTVAEV